MELTAHPAGTFCLPELNTPDMDGAKRLHGPLLAWTWLDVPGAAGGYTVTRIGQQSVAGLMSIRSEWGTVSPRWQVYFAVSDCDRAARQAPALEGRVVAGPTEVPEIGRFAILADASGAGFGVFQASNRP